MDPSLPLPFFCISSHLVLLIVTHLAIKCLRFPCHSQATTLVQIFVNCLLKTCAASRLFPVPLNVVGPPVHTRVVYDTTDDLLIILGCNFCLALFQGFPQAVFLFMWPRCSLLPSPRPSKPLLGTPAFYICSRVSPWLETIYTSNFSFSMKSVLPWFLASPEVLGKDTLSDNSISLELSLGCQGPVSPLQLPPQKRGALWYLLPGVISPVQCQNDLSKTQITSYCWLAQNP